MGHDESINLSDQHHEAEGDFLYKKLNLRRVILSKRSGLRKATTFSLEALVV